MISRKTIFSFVLGLLIFLSIRAWVAQHRDVCDERLPGGQKLGSVYVESGTRTVEMSCNVWLPRQTFGMQAVCLLDLVVTVVFLLSVWGDCSRWMERKRKAQR